MNLKNINKTDWNDWRRHLAMIVSNADESNKDLIFASIKTFGDSLAMNGRVAASHFCYLLAKSPFGIYNKKSSKIVLIGSSHNQEFNKFCKLTAIQATEIYEFAISLSRTSDKNSQFMDNFIKYKIIYASRLLEHGLINEAYKYIKVICESINNNPSLHLDKISTAYELANRLKICESEYDGDEQTWIKEIENNFRKFYLGRLSYLFNNKNIQNEQNNIELSTKLEPKTIENNFQNENEDYSKKINLNQYDSQQDVFHQHQNSNMLIKTEIRNTLTDMVQHHKGSDSTQYNSNNDQYNRNNDQYNSNNDQYNSNNDQYNSNNDQYNRNNDQYNSNNDQYNNNNAIYNQHFQNNGDQFGNASTHYLPNEVSYQNNEQPYADIESKDKGFYESESNSIQNINMSINYNSNNSQYQGNFSRSRNSSISNSYSYKGVPDQNLGNNISDQYQNYNQLVKSQTYPITDDKFSSENNYDRNGNFNFLNKIHILKVLN